MPQHWGQGCAAEALQALMDWCFRHLDIQRLYGECAVQNPRPARVMLKVGMAEEAQQGHEGERRVAAERADWDTIDDDGR